MTFRDGPPKTDVAARSSTFTVAEPTTGSGSPIERPQPSAWTGWTPIGQGVFKSKPSAARFNVLQRAVVGRGLDNAIWINVTSNGAFTGWQQIPGQTLDSAPAIVSKPPYLIVVARKASLNKVMWTRNDLTGGFNNANWTP